MKRAIAFIAGVLLTALIPACGTRVLVPPRIDLRAHEVLGIFDFESNARGELAGLATRKFLENAREEQGMVRVLELGSEAEVLRALGADRLDRDVIRKIGEKYQVNTLLTGTLTISDVRPSLVLDPGASFGSLSADVDAELTARMVETATGASLWGNSAALTQNVAQISVFGGKNFSFDAKDPEKAYGKLINALVHDVTRDFRSTWVTQ
jgi:hypothetical protein